MSTLILVAYLASILWLSEMLMLAKQDWTVSRKTPMSNLMGAKGNTFCNIFWGTSLSYLCLFLVIGGLSHLLVFFAIGVIELINGIATDNSAAAGLFIACSIFGIAFSMICWAVSKACGKIKEVATEKPAAFKLYYALKEAYCPILKQGKD
jgi:hypothetical protein